MISQKCKLQGLSGIKELVRVGPYLIITNRWLYRAGTSSRYVLIHEAKLWVHSVHASQHAAVIFARLYSNRFARRVLAAQIGDCSDSEPFT